jgi:nicotinate phosphoribosyltransferase
MGGRLAVFPPNRLTARRPREREPAREGCPGATGLGLKGPPFQVPRMGASDLPDRRFWIPTEEEIRSAGTTDEYFRNTREILRATGRDVPVVMEVYTTGLPHRENWGILAGTYEVAKLLEGRAVDLWALPEGEVFVSDSSRALYEPLLRLQGRYGDFAEFETAILGFLASFSSITTQAARLRRAAGTKHLLSFGTRRVHPALAPVVERGCYLGGFDGVSNVLGAHLLGIPPSGTMPHSLIQIVGSSREAWQLFDERMPKETRRIALVDTFADEKTEAIEAWETLGRKLWGVRLDTPRSRRGDFRRLIEEVRWELDLRGGRAVRIFVSGRLDEEEILRLRDLVDGFGIGTAVAYPPMIDFSAKIVEVQGPGGLWTPRSKRGALGGRKTPFRRRTTEGFQDRVLPGDPRPPPGFQGLLKPLLRNGRWVSPPEPLGRLRERVRDRLRVLSRGLPHLDGA